MRIVMMPTRDRVDDFLMIKNDDLQSKVQLLNKWEQTYVTLSLSIEVSCFIYVSIVIYVIEAISE